MNEKDFSAMGLEVLTGMLDSVFGGSGGGRRGSSAYSPYGKGKLILDTAMGHINSVSYKVSVRWVFYRLLQEGLYGKKADYTNFITLTSRARHSWYNGWNPAILADETRDIIIYENEGEAPDVDIEETIEAGIETAHHEIERIKDLYENYEYEHEFEIDPNYYQRGLFHHKGSCLMISDGIHLSVEPCVCLLGTARYII